MYAVKHDSRTARVGRGGGGSGVGAEGAGDATASPSKNFWIKLIRFGPIWLDLGKIKTLHPQNIRSSTAMGATP